MCVISRYVFQILILSHVFLVPESKQWMKVKAECMRVKWRLPQPASRPPNELLVAAEEVHCSLLWFNRTD